MSETFLAKFDEALKKGDLEAAELYYMDKVEEEGADLSVLLSAAKRLMGTGDSNQAAGLFKLLIEPSIQKGKEFHLEVLKYRALCSPDKKKYRRAFTNAFKNYYESDQAAMAYLKAANINDRPDLQEAFQTLDVLMQLCEGAYLQHPGGWGTGKVTSVSPLTGSMSVDLEEKKSHKVTLGAAASIFRPLPRTHFLAMLFDRKEELSALCNEKPVEVLKLLLTNFGSPQTTAKVRERLVPDVMSKKEWSSWWTRVRKHAAKDPYLRLIGGARPTIQLNEEPMSELDDLLGQFRDGDIKERVSIIKKCTQKSDDEKRNRVLELIDEFYPETDRPFEYTALRFKLGAATAEDCKRFLSEAENGPLEVKKLQVPELMRDVVTAVGNEFTFEEFVPYFLHAQSETIFKAAGILYQKDPEKFSKVVNDVFVQPRNHVWPFFWLYSVLDNKKWKKLIMLFPAHEILLRMLALLDSLYRNHEERRPSKEIIYGRNLFTKKKLAIFETILKNSKPDVYSDIFTQVAATRVLKEELKAIMREKVVMVAPELVKKRSGTVVGAIDDSVIYVTEAGFRRRQAEYNKLVNEDIPAVIEEVGRAQEFGDLSENAEWTAALEKRDQFGDRAKRLKEELQKVRFITGDMYHENQVSLGAAIVVKSLDDDETSSWKLLGPWDGDQTDGILNYLSPMGRALLGKKTEESVEVTLPEGTKRFEIVSISPGL